MGHVFFASITIFYVIEWTKEASQTHCFACQMASAQPSIANFDESLVVALCKSIYDGGQMPQYGRESAFAHFMFPDLIDRDPNTPTIEDIRSHLNVVKSKQLSSWDAVDVAFDSLSAFYTKIGRPHSSALLAWQDNLKMAIEELLAEVIPNFKDYLHEILLRTVGRVGIHTSHLAIAEEFDAKMRLSVVSAAKLAASLMTKNAQLIDATFSSLKLSLASPNIGTVSNVLDMLDIVLANVATARDAFLGCQIPSYTLLAVLTHATGGQPITSESRLNYDVQIGLTKHLPSYIAMPAPPINEAIKDVINSSKHHLEGSVIAPVIAARIWALYKAFRQAKGFPPNPAPMLEGGAQKKKKRRANDTPSQPIFEGGVMKDVATARIDINTKFGSKIVKLVQEMADTIESVVNNSSPHLIGFLADGATRPLIAAFMEVNFPSNSYIPILSGYYRIAEAESRRKRYLTNLASLSEAVEKVVGAASSLDGASRNAFNKCKGIAKEMIGAVEESNREMDAAFAKLASGQIAEVTAADTQISTGKEEVSSVEAGGQTSDAHAKLTKALERLREAAHAAPSKKTIFSGLDKIEEYMKNGKKLCEESIKSRLDELNLSYTGVLAHVDPAVKNLAKKVVDFKMESLREFYQTLLDTEMYLAKAHKSFLASPSVRDELYRAISGWTLAVQKSASIEERFKREVDELLRQIFSSDDMAIFSYFGAAGAENTVAARRLGYGRITQAAPVVGDAVVAGRPEEDGIMFDKFRRALLQMMNYCPQLHLVFNLVNIIEKTFGREFDTKKLYESTVHFIVASAVDVCTRAEAMAPYDANGLRGAGIHFVGRYAGPPAAAPHLIAANDDLAIDYYITGARAAAGANGCALPPTESTCGVNTGEVGVYFRHALGELRFEDAMFVRWLKSICANLLLALDRDRATHGVEKVNLPGAERLLIGGALDDPIGLTGSHKVIPEVVPLYVAFPAACRAYEAYFTWEASKLHWRKTDEPRLIIDVARGSPYYTMLEVVRGHKSVEPLSETYIAQLVSATNTIWGHFASIPDPDKRKTAILDNFFDEINNTLMMRMTSEQDEADAQREMDKDKDAISGVGPTEDKIAEVASKADSRKTLRRKIFSALKGISMSVYDIMNRVNTSEENMANDYKAYVERVQKRISDVPDQDRFRELVRAMQSPDETVGDVQGIFTAFVEFVVTPMFLIASITENFVWRSVNLYMQILRALFSARYSSDRAAGTIAAGAIGAVAAAGTLARHWLTYAANANPNPAGHPTVPDPGLFGSAGYNASHTERVAHVLQHMEKGNFTQLAAAPRAHASREAFFEGAAKYYLHMHQPIYKALELLLDVSHLDFKVADSDNARIGSINADKFYALIDDSVADLKASLGVFMKIGKREFADKYFRDITSWEPRDMLKDVADAVNKALGIVHCDFYMLREYLPTAVCFDEDAPAIAGPVGPVGRNWVVNFSRNVPNAAALDQTKQIISYHEAIQSFVGAPTRWTHIAWVRANNPASSTQEVCNNWTSLDSKHGIFSPIVKMGNRSGPGTGLMPWGGDDTTVIEGGWDGAPENTLIQVGPGLNTPVLYVRPEAGGVGHIEEAGFPALNLGSSVAGAIGALGGGNDDETIAWGHDARPTNAAIRAYNTGPVIQSLLYKNPSHGTKAETFNRLLVKMASCLTLQGEQPCILYDLANDIVSHPGMSRYFHTTDITIPGARPDQSQTFTCFPDAIGTPVRVNNDWHMLYTGLEVWNVNPTGAAAAAPALATAPHPIAALNDGTQAPLYKAGTFLYDVALSPYFNSATGKTARRVAELSNAEMARYLAAIPQFLTAFKSLLGHVEADIKMRADAANPGTHPAGKFQGVDSRGAAGHVHVHDIVLLPGEIQTLPNKMKQALMAIIECLARSYRAIREKYGSSVHMEMVKGDFDPYLTGGKFDSAKLSTPLSMMAGMSMVDANGPVVLANFCERGSRHTDTAMSLAWASLVGHREIAGSDVISLESVPWAVAVSERLKKMTNVSMDMLLQPLITRIARLGFVQNAMNLTALACHNPWGCHSIASAIFHPHILEVHVASMRAGFDLLRRIDRFTIAVPAMFGHFMLESCWPWLAQGMGVQDLSLRERLCNDIVLGGAAGSLGAWVTPPFPVTYDVGNFDRDRALNICYTANAFTLAAGSQEVSLNHGPAGNPVVLDVGVARGPIANAAAQALHVTGRRDLGNSFIQNAGIVAGTAPGVLIAAILQQMRMNQYEQAWLKDDRPKKHFFDRMQAYGPLETDGTVKRIDQWLAAKTKPKVVVEKQFGFKLRDGEYDGTYIEMVRFSPPKERWADELTAEERHMTGLFMYLKRNPVSILTTLRLVPFASIYSFSEAFDLYFQIAARRSAKTKSEALVRSHIPSLILNPLSLTRRYVDLSTKERTGETWLLTDPREWNGTKAAPLNTGVNSSATIGYDKREQTRIQDTGLVGEAAAAGVADSYQSIRPAGTSIPTFYAEKRPVNGQEIGLCAPSNDAVVQNHALTAFPLFSMYVRMLDQYGIVLKEELAARLGEIRYDRPESLAQYQDALINVLGAGAP